MIAVYLMIAYLCVRIVFVTTLACKNMTTPLYSHLTVWIRMTCVTMPIGRHAKIFVKREMPLTVGSSESCSPLFPVYTCNEGLTHFN